jgi:hypothetical protein
MKFSITIFLSVFSTALFAQLGFTRNMSIPVNESDALEMAWAGGINFPLFSEIDLNNDGTPDLFVYDRSNARVMTFINKGGSGIHCWQYAPQYEAGFPAIKGWAFLYDYNCDNKPDIFSTNNSNNGIAIYKNISQSGSVQFELVDSAIGFYVGSTFIPNIIASSYLQPAFDDIDGDGDMDILGQQFTCVGAFAYYKNMTMEHYGNCDSLDDFVLETNSWGKFGLRSGAYPNVIVANWNINCFQSPNDHFSYEVARRDDTYANLKTIDIDGDGDKDVIIGDSQATNSLLVVNGGSNQNALMVSQDTAFPSYNVSVHLRSFTSHSFVDADNDGIKDLIVSQSEVENKNGALFYKNNGTNAVPVYSRVMDNFLQSEMIDVGESATPVLFDYDGDGLKDLVIGNLDMTTGDSSAVTGLYLYKNTGTASAPAFTLITTDFANLNAMHLAGQIFPAFGDLDADNDQDMILGLDDGKLMYFENIAGPGVSPVFTNPIYPYMSSSLDVGQASTPQLFDLNKDNLLDLIIGGKNGLIKFYKNAGTASSPVFLPVPTNDTLGNFVVQTPGSPDGYSSAFAFDQNGSTRMLVSCMNGNIYLYGNIDGNLSGAFTRLDTVYSKVGGTRYGYNISVSGGDLNNDTLADMLIGLYGGGVQVYYQDNILSTGSQAAFESKFSIFPNPTSEYIFINSKINSDNTLYTIYDLEGREIMTGKIKGETCKVNLSSISAGIYVLKIKNPDFSFAKKIIVKD